MGLGIFGEILVTFLFIRGRCIVLLSFVFLNSFEKVYLFFCVFGKFLIWVRDFKYVEGKSVLFLFIYGY